MIVLKIFVAIALFTLCVMAPGLMGVLLLAFVMYAVADTIVDEFLGKNKND